MPITRGAGWRHSISAIVIAGLSLATLAAIAALASSANVPFHRFFGALQPALVASVVVAMGAVCHWFLQSRGWLLVFGPSPSRTRLGMFAGIAVLFSVSAALSDILAGYPEDMNVLLPHALLFYPAMGYLAEIVFHVLPLVLLLGAASLLRGAEPGKPLPWWPFVVAALTEPAFQVAAGLSGGNLTGLDAFVMVHIFLIALVQMLIYRRHGFVHMFLFRMVYYLGWHIVWGQARLAVLF